MTSEPTPRVTVLLLAYNRAARLPATLDSLLAQTFSDFELIASDDCSTDGTPEVCAEYARRDPRVRHRRNARNLRMPGNLNAALAEARGEYVAIAHDGDLYREDLLEKWVDVMDRHPTAGFVFNAYRYEIFRRGVRRVDRLDLPECMGGREFLGRIFSRHWDGSPVYGTVMLRKACLDAVGPFDPRFSMHSDLEMWFRLASRYDVAYVPELLMTLAAREADHPLAAHYWWEKTVDVRVKRMAARFCHPGEPLERLRFELHARMHYAWHVMLLAKNGRWSEAAKGLFILATGRDDVPPPY